jgi:hypothetical protein
MQENTISNLCSFSEIINDLLDGKKATRLDWKDADTYLLIYNGFLSIQFSKEPTGNCHQLIVSEADMSATDWLVIK